MVNHHLAPPFERSLFIFSKHQRCKIQRSVERLETQLQPLCPPWTVTHGVPTLSPTGLRLHWTFGFTEGLRFVVGILGGNLRGAAICFKRVGSKLAKAGEVEVNWDLLLFFLKKMDGKKRRVVKCFLFFLPERVLVGCF